MILQLISFFSIAMNENEQLPVFDHSQYNVIVFDEIYFNALHIYRKIQKFIANHKHEKIIIATGDINQLPTIQPLSNVKPFEEYANECIMQIFPYEIFLTECKRLASEQDRVKLTNIKRDIFIHKLPFKTIAEKYFAYTDKVELCDNNIAYFNNTCKTISRAIRQQLNKSAEYEINDEVICKEYTKVKNQVFNVNFRYRIIDIQADSIFLQNIKTLEIQTIYLNYLRNRFIYSYCFTCHSTQGCSVDGDIVIYDWNQPCVSREWFYVAITRGRDLNKIKFYKYE